MIPMSTAARVLARAVAVAASTLCSTGDVDIALAELAWTHEQERDQHRQAVLAHRLYRICHGETT